MLFIITRIIAFHYNKYIVCCIFCTTKTLEKDVMWTPPHWHKSQQTQMFYVLHDNKYIVLKNGQTSEIFFGIKDWIFHEQKNNKIEICWSNVLFAS